MSGHLLAMGSVHDREAARRLGRPPKTPAQILRRAQAVLDASNVLADLEAKFDHVDGRPRALPVRTFLLGWFMSPMLQRDGFITEIRSALFSLSNMTRRDLGLIRDDGEEVTYDQFDHFFNVLTRALERGWCREHPGDRVSDGGESCLHGCKATCRHGCDEPCDHDGYVLCGHGCAALDRRDMNWLKNAVTDASMPADINLGTSFALDSTNYESHFARQSRAPKVDDQSDDIDLWAARRKQGSSKKTYRNADGWPTKGPDGRWMHCKDHDAREGHEPSKNGNRGSTFLGYQLFGVTPTPPRRGTGVSMPQIIRRWDLVPAGSHPGWAGAKVVEEAVDDGIKITDLSADMAFTIVYPENFHYRVRGKGVDIVMDVHASLRGLQPVAPGIVAIDGTIFPDWLPAVRPDLVSLTKPDVYAARRDPEGPGARQFQEQREKFDYRAQFAFRRITVSKDGTERWVGPAYCSKGRTAKVRCVNFARSMSKGSSLERTPCKKNDGCKCGAILTLGADEVARTRQLHPWQSTAWFEDYRRRAAVEAPYALLKEV